MSSLYEQINRSNLLLDKYIEAKIIIWKYENKIPHREDFADNEWWLSSIIRNCFYEIHYEDINTLYQWLKKESINLPAVIKEANIAIDKINYVKDCRQEEVDNFDSKKRETEYISDPLVPRGNVHYHIVCRFKDHCGYFSQFRQTAIEGREGFYFDYFGPEEDDNGLIHYLDY